MNSTSKSCSLPDYLDILITPITSIIKASIKQGKCPNFFKQAHVTLILKSSLDKEVSNLNFISKILERVVAVQLQTHLDEAWFKSYLSGRTHSVKLGSTLSHLAVLQYRVPQGSVLGPILFSLYTNPISSIIHSHSSINYHFNADDTQLYIILSSVNFSHSKQKLKK